MPTRRHFLQKITLGASVLMAQPTLENLLPEKKKIGIALVGLGNYANIQIAPALLETAHCRLRGIVTGSPEKVPIWCEKYNIPKQNVYNYQNFDAIRNNPDIDIVYVLLPNSMHAEYTIRAAKAGKHVICEKPMALNVVECEAMIKACKEANVLLSVGYRLYFEPHHLEMRRLGTQKIHGALPRGFSVSGAALAIPIVGEG